MKYVCVFVWYLREVYILLYWTFSGFSSEAAVGF